MKLIDAIRRVQRPENPSRWQFDAPITELCSDLSIAELWDWSEELDMRLKAYPIFDWLCTDEMVGLYAVYLDDRAVGCYYRSGRKMDYQFSWLSKEDADEVRTVLLSYVTADERVPISLITPDMDTAAFAYLGDVDTRLKVMPDDSDNLDKMGGDLLV